MAPSKPPDRKLSKRPPPRLPSRPHAAIRGEAPRPAFKDDARLSQCEAAIVGLHDEVAALRNELHELRVLVSPGGSKGRKRPPPLPDGKEGDEVIVVDEREVVLESIRPRPRR
jgi:hypothetical protein